MYENALYLGHDLNYDTYYLQHHGIKGMKWGVRRYQNEDGTLTPAGQKRYYNSDGSMTDAGKKFKAKKYQKEIDRMLTNSNDLMNNLWVLNETKALNEESIQKNKSNKEMAKRFIEENKIVDMKLKDLGSRYHKQEKDINDFLNKVYKDKDVVYKVSDWRVTNASKNAKKMNKDLEDKYGKTKLRSFTPGATYRVTNDKFVIKPGIKKYNKKKDFNDVLNKQRRGQKLTKEMYYYY